MNFVYCKQNPDGFTKSFCKITYFPYCVWINWKPQDPAWILAGPKCSSDTVKTGDLFLLYVFYLWMHYIFMWGLISYGVIHIILYEIPVRSPSRQYHQTLFSTYLLHSSENWWLCGTTSQSCWFLSCIKFSMWQTYIYIFFIIIHVISLPIRALNVLFDLGFGLFSYHILNASCSNLSVSAFDHLLVLYCL